MLLPLVNTWDIVAAVGGIPILAIATTGMSDLMSLATAESVTPTAVMTGIVTRMAETTVTGVTVVARLRAVTPRTIEDAGATPEALPEAVARQGPGTTMPHPPAHCLPTGSRRAGKDTGDWRIGSLKWFVSCKGRPTGRPSAKAESSSSEASQWSLLARSHRVASIFLKYCFPPSGHAFLHSQ